MDYTLWHILSSLLNVTVRSFWKIQEWCYQSGIELAFSKQPSWMSNQCDHTPAHRPWTSSFTFLEFLSDAEAQEIMDRFESMPRANCQLVFWTRIPRERAQEWADARGMSTLTTMMGPLMDSSHERCQRSIKGPTLWSKYIKGASILFAHYACRIGAGASAVRVSTIPPLLQLAAGRPTSTFLLLEEPILRGKLGGSQNKHKNRVRASND